MPIDVLVRALRGIEPLVAAEIAERLPARDRSEVMSRRTRRRMSASVRWLVARKSRESRSRGNDIRFSRRNSVRTAALESQMPRSRASPRIHSNVIRSCIAWSRSCSYSSLPGAGICGYPADAFAISIQCSKSACRIGARVQRAA